MSSEYLVSDFGEEVHLRVTHLRVVWEDHGDGSEPDWAYHLRMGDIDCDEATVSEQAGWLASYEGEPMFHRIDCNCSMAKRGHEHFCTPLYLGVFGSKDGAT